MNPNPASQPPPMVSPIQDPPPSKRGVFVLAVLAVLLLGGGVAGVLWWRSGDDPAPPAKPTKPTPTPIVQHSSCSDDADPKRLEPIEYGEPLGATFDRSALDGLEKKPIPDVEVYPWLPENLVAIFGEHRMRGNLLTASPDGKLLAMGVSNYPIIRVGPIETLHETHLLRCPGGPRFLAWSPAGDVLAVVCRDRHVRLFDVRNLDEIRQPVSLEQSKEAVVSVSFSGDGKYLVGRDTAEIGSAWVWEVESRKIVKRLQHIGPVRDAKFSPTPGDYRVVTSGGPLDGRLHLWKALEGTQQELNFTTGKQDDTTEVGAVAFSDDGKQVLSCHPDSKIRVWDLANFVKEKPVAVIATRRPASRAVFTPDGKRVLGVTQNGRDLRMWDASTGKVVARRLGPFADVQTLFFLPSSDADDAKPVLVFCGRLNRDPNVHLLELDTNKERLPPVGHVWSTTAVRVSPTGSHVISAARDSSLRVWNLAKGEEERRFSIGQATGVGFFADGKRAFAYGPSFSTLGVFDLVAGKNVTAKYSASHRGAIRSAAVTLDGRYAVTGGQDGNVCLWRISDGFLLRRFEGGKFNRPIDVALCPDMRRVVATNSSRTALLHLRCGQVLHEWKPARWVEFHSNSKAMFFRGKSIDEWNVLGFDEPTPGGKTPFTLPSNTARHLDEKHRRVAVVTTGLAGVSAQRVVVLDVESQRELWSWSPPDHLGGVEDVALSADGGHLVTANGDGTVYVIRLP